jgi:hypothetical protein
MICLNIYITIFINQLACQGRDKNESNRIELTADWVWFELFLIQFFTNSISNFLRTFLRQRRVNVVAEIKM